MLRNSAKLQIPRIKKDNMKWNDVAELSEGMEDFPYEHQVVFTRLYTEFFIDTKDWGDLLYVLDVTPPGDNVGEDWWMWSAKRPRWKPLLL